MQPAFAGIIRIDVESAAATGRPFAHAARDSRAKCRSSRGFKTVVGRWSGASRNKADANCPRRPSRRSKTTAASIGARLPRELTRGPQDSRRFFGRFDWDRILPDASRCFHPLYKTLVPTLRRRRWTERCRAPRWDHRDGRAQRRKDSIGVTGTDGDGGNLLAVAEAEMRPGFAGVEGFVDAVAGRCESGRWRPSPLPTW